MKKAISDRSVQSEKLAAFEARLKRALIDLDRKRTLIRSSATSRDTLEEAELAVAEARSDLATAQKQLEAGQAAIDESKAGLEAQETGRDVLLAELQQRRAEVESARVALDRTRITSPIEGTVIERNVERGQTVAADLDAPVLFTIARQLDRMQIHAHVDEADIGQISLDQSVTFETDAYPEQVFQGNVAQVRRAPQTTENVVTYTVVIDAANTDQLLLPGMTAYVDVSVFRTDNTTKVSNEALFFDPPVEFQSRDLPEGDKLWVLRSGAPEAVPVELGRGDDVETEVLGDELGEADRVLVGYQTRKTGWRLPALRLSE